MEMELFEGNPKVLMGYSHRPAPVETQPVPEPEIGEGPLLSEVIEKYLKWQEKLPTDHAAKWNDPSAKSSHRAALNLFVEFQGELPFVKSSYGVKVGDWFREYKRSYGINPPKKAPKKDFHSLRKNFINLASQKNVPIEKRRAITGHALGSGVDSTTYVGDLPVKQLLDEVIAQIVFHKTLKLGFLKNSQFVIK